MAAKVGIRPEHLHLASNGQGIPAEVVLAEHLGDSSILHVKVEGVNDLMNVKIVSGHADCDAGQPVLLDVDAPWALAFDAQGHLIR
jgi:multiple sugar transport system ATP-binding protein